MHVSKLDILSFNKTIGDYYKKHKRILAWREHIDPYHVFVSEVMLQQTQVKRVSEKFPPFIKRFSDFATLAKASLKEVLTMWQGMGYNRRAKYLHESARIIVDTYKGMVPDDPNILDTLPGIGRATAHSIAVFTGNKPYVFIETNIRRVFIHFFFKDKNSIDDKEIIPLIEKTMDTKNPREWYYALMDYGSNLPKLVRNPNMKSKHYKKQSRFDGSDRQIRGQILKHILEKSYNIEELERVIPYPKERIIYNIIKLTGEGIVIKKKGRYRI